MRLERVMLPTVALMLAGSVAFADCQAELARLTGGGAKDGSMAPLAADSAATPQTGGDATAPEAAAEGVAKDGTGTPLGADPGIATSAQDVEAQQQGGATAAEQAMMGEPGAVEPDGQEAAIARAEEAMAAGDEAGCMAVLEQAKAM